MTAVKGRCDATTVAILATFPDSVKSKSNNKAIMQVNIRGKN